ncbi:MAG: M28 family peptidase [Chthoniobacterales bacterium]
MPKKKKRPSRRPQHLSARKSPARFDWSRHGGYALLAAAVLLVSLFFFLRPSGPRYGQPWKEFFGANAFRHVTGLVGLGPRPPESEAIKKARAYIRAQLEATGWQVIDQPFAAQTPRGTVQFVNLIARRPNQPENEKLFFVGSHYDTKTFESIQFVGANDGGSSSGALIELGRVLSLHPELAARIELLFFDGEEAYERFSKTDGLYGSRYFAEKARKAKRTQNYEGGIVWDMIGDRDLTITLPADSPAKLAEGIFAAADALQLRDHFTYLSDDMLDDHTPFHEVGIPTIDLIDFDYPPWHTAGDTMDKLSPESLQIVGAVTLYYLAERAFK